jgi:hypothetical protein
MGHSSGHAPAAQTANLHQQPHPQGGSKNAAASSYNNNNNNSNQSKESEYREPPPYLVDLLLDKNMGACEASADVAPFSENLARFLRARPIEFSGVCAYAACRLQVCRFD